MHRNLRTLLRIEYRKTDLVNFEHVWSIFVMYYVRSDVPVHNLLKIEDLQVM